MRLTAQEICQATGGTLVRGFADTVFTAVSIDSRTVPTGALFVPLPGTQTDGHAFLSAAVQHGAAGFFFAEHVNPELPANAVAIRVKDPLAALQHVATWYRNRLQARVIGIAGSNGKTTTKELMAQVFASQKKTWSTQGNLNNHIGLPLTILRADDDVQAMVLELGTSGAGELTTLSEIARPEIGVITSIAEEHTETLKDLAGVIAAETELITALPPQGLAIVNGDHAGLLEAVHRQARCRIVTFGELDTNQFRISNLQVTRQGTHFALATPAGTHDVQLQLLGSHFALAAAASIAAATTCGIALADACAALSTAKGAARRMAVVNVPARRLTVLDDCYNANPASMQQALLTVQQVRTAGERVILVLGDMLELGDLSKIRHQQIGTMAVALLPLPDLVVTVGKEAKLIAAAVKKTPVPVRWFAKSDRAATFVRKEIDRFHGPQLVLVKGSRGIRLEEVTKKVAEM
ncbi:MAG: UDP-N-acetylmuramoyl-tripeptide--D-alanyl-D-alanine ligase [Deltaproteobacteria bacterium]|nr:UDP-N-acetylmuramoyl-tripeptide--D-alanyl-D-alanine ligase [Deltaproteobacteria bacterium]